MLRVGPLSASLYRMQYVGYSPFPVYDFDGRMRSQFKRRPVPRRNRVQSFETECGGIRGMENIENCSFEPGQVGNERPTFGKRMIVEKVRQVETRVKYRWLPWGMLQQVLLDQGRE